MNPVERIIALDEALDEIIFSRAQRVYDDEMEFRANPEDERRGIGVGGALGGTAALGAAAYGGSLAYRNKRNAAFGDSSIKGVARGDFNTARDAGSGFRQGVAANAKKAKGRFKMTRNMGGGRIRAAGNAISPGKGAQLAGYGKKLKKGLGALRGKLKFEDEQETIEFMYDGSGKAWGEESRRQGRRGGMHKAVKRGRYKNLAKKYGKRAGAVGGVAALGYGLGRMGRKSD
jgi:hypothetical protein